MEIGGFLVIMGVVLVVGSLLTILLFKLNDRRFVKGYMPKQVLKGLNRFASVHKYTLYHDIIIENNDQRIPVDYLITGDFGAFFVRREEVFGEVYGTLTEDRWVSLNGKERVPFKNPVKATESFTAEIKKFFTAHDFGDMYLGYVTVFPASTSLNFPKSVPITTANMLTKYIGKINDLEPTVKDTALLNKLIEENISK